MTVGYIVDRPPVAGVGEKPTTPRPVPSKESLEMAQLAAKRRAIVIEHVHILKNEPERTTK